MKAFWYSVNKLLSDVVFVFMLVYDLRFPSLSSSILFSFLATILHVSSSHVPAAKRIFWVVCTPLERGTRPSACLRSWVE